MRRWQTFSHFCTIGISMYQNNMLPYFIITSTFSPQDYSPLERYRQTDFNTPCYLSSFFFHWARGALPAGATLLGWPNYGVDGRLNKARLSWTILQTQLSSQKGNSWHPPCRQRQSSWKQNKVVVLQWLLLLATEVAPHKDKDLFKWRWRSVNDVWNTPRCDGCLLSQSVTSMLALPTLLSDPLHIVTINNTVGERIKKCTKESLTATKL